MRSNENGAHWAPRFHCLIVILSEAKDLLFLPGKQILRVAQDDKVSLAGNTPLIFAGSGIDLDAIAGLAK